MRRSIHPSQLTAEQIEELRESFMGRRDGAERVGVRGGVAYVSTDARGRACAVGFAGRALRPAFNLWFSSEERRRAYLVEWEAGLVAKAEAKAARATARSANKHSLMVGSILVSTWGYEQTNRDFYQVVAVRGSTVVEVRQIESNVDADHSAMTGKATPVADAFAGPTLRKRATSDGIRINSFSTAQPWDGQPKSCTWYG